MSGKESSQAETAGLVAASPKSPKSKGLRNSLISVFKSRGGSAEQSTNIDDSRYGGSSVIDASLAQISVARVRPEDEADLKVKNSGFFKLFHKADLNSNNKMNVRYKAAVWSGVKPTFQSKLMVAKSQGVVKEENVKGGVHIIRTFKLFLPEWRLLLVGFLLSISSTIAGQFLPQLSVPYTNALFCLQSYQTAVGTMNRVCPSLGLDPSTPCPLQLDDPTSQLFGSSNSYIPSWRNAPIPCSDSDPNSPCDCTGPFSDQPKSCPPSAPNCAQQIPLQQQCTFCGVTPLARSSNLDCCGGGAPYSGFYLTGGGTFKAVDFWWGVQVIVTVYQIVSGLVQSTIFFIAFRKIMGSVRRAMMLNILQQDMGFFEIRTTGELISRLQNQVNQLLPLGTLVPTVITTLSTLGISSVFMFNQSTTLAIIYCSYLPLVVAYQVWITRFSRRWQLVLLKEQAEQSSIVMETLNNVRTIRAFNGYKAASLRFTAQVNRLFQINMYIQSVSTIGSTLLSCISQFVGYSIMYIAGQQIIGAHEFAQTVPFFDRDLDIGTYQAFQSYKNNFSGAVTSLNGIFSSVITALTSAESLAVFMFRKAALGGETTMGKGVALENMQGSFRFSKVHFLYSSRPGQPILRGLTLTIPAKKLTCIMGQSGCGKSTLLALMMRLYEPLSGNILLDGVDLTKLDIAWLRSVIALVGQEPILFSWSLKDNLLYGKPNATEKEIEHAIQESGAAEIISKLPDGIETKMSAGTTNLSVGQRQRLIIARAFLRNAPLLLLDEPTSALDVRSEELVTEAIGRLRQGRTCVMITHRISTARDADFIAVMKEGNLVESGSPKELLDNPSSVFKQYFQQNQQTAPTGGRPPLGVVPSPGEGGLGVKITQVVAGGLAAITGIQAGDVWISIASVDLTTLTNANAIAVIKANNVHAAPIVMSRAGVRLQLALGIPPAPPSSNAAAAPAPVAQAASAPAAASAPEQASAAAAIPAPTTQAASSSTSADPKP